MITPEDIRDLRAKRAPWTDEHIAFLKQWQESGEFHPYTCGKDSSHILEPTPNGWICPHCDYKQDWSH